MNANYVSEADWTEWETVRVERARADLDRTAWQNRRPTTDHLLDAIAELEDRLELKSVLLESAMEMLNARAVPGLRVAA